VTEIKAEENQNDLNIGSDYDIERESKVHLLFLGVLSVSFIGYFALRSHWIGFAFGHLAAISIMGFYGSLAGYIARKKGLSYGFAFKIGFFIPIILGIISAFLLVDEGSRLPLTCGGWTALAAGIVVALVYLFLPKKDRGDYTKV